MQYIPIIIDAVNLKDQKREALKIASSHIPKLTLPNPNFYILESDAPSIGIKEIKEFSKAMKLKPFSSNISIFFIPKFENATMDAQNAMLKQLEEPSSNILILLGTSKYKKLLTTITSRCLLQRQGSETNDIESIYVQKFLNGKLNERFKLVDEILNKNTPDKLKEIISNLIDCLIKALYQEKIVHIDTLFKLLKYKEYLEANINKRLLLEK